MLDKSFEDTGNYKFMVGEAYGRPDQLVPFYKYNDKKGLDMPFNMDLTNLKADCNAKCVRDLVTNWMAAVPSDKWANWQVGGVLLNYRFLNYYYYYFFWFEIFSNQDCSLRCDF